MEIPGIAGGRPPLARGEVCPRAPLHREIGSLTQKPAASLSPIAATSGTSNRTGCRSGAREGVRGLLAPVLDHLAVGFNAVHDFSSATLAHNVAEDDDGRDLI